MPSQLKLIFIPCEENKYRPKFLAGNFLYYYAIILLILKIIIIPVFIYLPKSLLFADLTEVSLIELTNKNRESLGISTLTESQVLKTAAYLKAKDMLEKDYFSHSSPEGLTPWYWFKASGYNYKYAGENLAIGFLDSEEVNQAWLSSPSHKENILDPNYSEIGIAVLKGDFAGKETTIVVQFFGTSQAKAAVLPAETQQNLPQAAAENENVLPKESAAETGQISIQEVASASKTTKNNLTFNFLSFLSSGYYGLLQGVIYGSLLFITISLFITVFFDIFIYRAFEIQYKDIVLKAASFSVLLIILLSFDKGTILQLIPHNLIIF
ncbi:MAG: CAP domain-containing protein [Candidatus Pacebacteria bacterium]|nr:CAP domain-containing protein [Candidatus Paceibacterota bacterium]